MTDSPPSPVSSNSSIHEDGNNTNNSPGGRGSVEPQQQRPSSTSQSLPPPSPAPATSSGTAAGGAATSTPQHQQQQHGVSRTPSGKEQQLIELLSNAAQEIRNERAKVTKLREENEDLRNKLYSSQQQKEKSLERAGGKSGPMLHTGTKADQATIQNMKNKMMDLSLENHLALEQMTILRKKVVELEATVAKQQDELKTMNEKKRFNLLHHPTHQYEPSTANRANSRERRATASPQNNTKLRRSASASAPHTARGVEKVPNQAHYFDAMASVQQTHNSTGASGAQGADPNNQKTYNDMMIARLRRAIAPPPSKEQIAEVVHAMVVELSKSLASRGTKLPLKKVGPCIYQCGERRKLHLTVDSGRLMVKQGGGHVDLLEYLERNKVCSALESNHHH